MKMYLIYHQIPERSDLYQKFKQRVQENCASINFEEAGIIFGKSYAENSEELHKALFKNPDVEGRNIVVEMKGFYGRLPYKVADWLDQKMDECNKGIIPQQNREKELLVEIKDLKERIAGKDELLKQWLHRK